MESEHKAIVPIQLRFADLDMAHHAHNAVYLHWFELARMALLRRFIPPGHDWKNQGLILARNEVDYRAPVHLNDEIEVECWCSAIGSKSFDLEYAVVRVKKEERTICAEGRSVMVCFDYVESRTIGIPENWRGALSNLTGR
ncbi:MAG: acyl-CoA thioesterase [Flavobacteriales bacterium]|nr:acyl-CoA thioesterase [Flavobacteriales bacterium]MCC6938809.1 acyl-CoA thioesterase [Flavobacteriales bacterium]